MSAHQDEEMDVIARILQAAGRRQPAPDAIRERVLAAASAALAAKRGARRRRVAWQFAAAAAAVVAVVGLALLLGRGASSLPAAFSDQFVGSADYRADAGDPWAVMVRDRRLPAGSEVRTGQGGRVGLVLAQGASLRLDEMTEIRLVDSSRVELLAGTVYVDSGVVGHAVEVVTAVAVTRDIGTQFEVRYRAGEQRVRVREGTVLMRLGEDEYRGGAGEQLLVPAYGRVQRARIAVNDSSWEWVQLVVRTPDIEGRPLSELLDWVVRETGRKVRYESPSVQALTHSTILHGSVRNLGPLPAVQTVIATTDLDLAILEDGSLLVKSRDRGDQNR